MLSIRLNQQFLIFVISPDYDTVITQSLLILMIDSKGYFSGSVVGRMKLPIRYQ